MKRWISLVLFLLLLSAAISAADDKDKNSATNSNFFPVEQVRPGMKGTGKTVFEGTQIEEFGVEILGVLEGFPLIPKQKTIIARLSGPRIDRYSVFAGISGSPVYIDGKLLGAVAYGFPFSKEPIAGITPITQMVELFEQNDSPPAQQSGPRRYSFEELAGSNLTQSLPGRQSEPIPIGAQWASNPSLAPYVGQALVPIATPVSFSGITQAALQQFAPQLEALGIRPVVGVSGGSHLGPLGPIDDKTLAPGSSVSVQLIRGDFTIDAAGTVTHRDGDRIYAFGHNFFGMGKVNLPMAESSVVVVIPNVASPFKLSKGGNTVGTISQDRSMGVFGKLGVEPKMIPVTVNVNTSRNKQRTYKYEVMSDPVLTPLLMNVTMLSTITSTERGIGESTLRVRGRISVKGQPDVTIENRFSALSNAPFLAMLSVSQPVGLLLSSGFRDVNIAGIEVNIDSVDSRNSGSLDRIWIDKTEVKRGERIEVQAFARNDNGNEFVQRIPLEIPLDMPLGKLHIVVSDGASLNTLESRLSPSLLFSPKSLSQLIREINKRRKNDRLYVKLLHPGDGAIINNEEMPSLPPSVLATLGSSRTAGGFTPLNLVSRFEQELPPAEFVISGQRIITIEVTR